MHKPPSEIAHCREHPVHFLERDDQPSADAIQATFSEMNPKIFWLEQNAAPVFAQKSSCIIGIQSEDHEMLVKRGHPGFDGSASCNPAEKISAFAGDDGYFHWTIWKLNRHPREPGIGEGQRILDHHGIHLKRETAALTLKQDISLFRAVP